MTNSIVPRRRNRRSPGAGAMPAARRRQGVSLVELALATPFLLLLMLGTIDLGRMFFDYIQLRQAVVEGATYGARNPKDTSGIQAQVTSHNVPVGTVVTPSTQTGCFTAGDTGTITVTASHTFTPITLDFLAGWWGLGSVNLSASSTMRCLT